MRRTLTLLAVLLVSVATGMAIAGYRAIKVPVTVTTPVRMLVAPGASPAAIAGELARLGVVRNARALVLLAKLRRKDREFRSGEHVFEGTLSLDDVLAELIDPNDTGIRVTIPEGKTWREIGQILEARGVVSAADYYAAVCDPQVVALAGAPATGNCSEGFLFPDTYNLSSAMTAVEIARTQIQNFHHVVRRVLASTPPGAANAVLPPTTTGDRPFGIFADEPAHLDILRAGTTLASVIEKETGIESERPLVAAVFHNRLARGMLLQADPTVIYGLDNGGAAWDRGRLHEHLREPGPYNSYMNPGLPPGPICNPGERALQAAFAPAATDHLYFVAKGDGSHRFSRTLAEHNRAVAELRRRRSPSS